MDEINIKFSRYELKTLNKFLKKFNQLLDDIASFKIGTISDLIRKFDKVLGEGNEADNIK